MTTNREKITFLESLLADDFILKNIVNESAVRAKIEELKAAKK